jgi:hypothetical protein
MFPLGKQALEGGFSQKGVGPILGGVPYVEIQASSSATPQPIGRRLLLSQCVDGDHLVVPYNNLGGFVKTQKTSLHSWFDTSL